MKTEKMMVNFEAWNVRNWNTGSSARHAIVDHTRLHSIVFPGTFLKTMRRQ